MARWQYTLLWPMAMKVASFLLGMAMVSTASAAQALPGQFADEATAWIQANPTLRPARGERLLIRKSSTPAQRFTFQALPSQVGRAATGFGGGIIRTEELAVYDMINGVTPYRLQESLRSIYGSDIYRDFSQGRRVYAYPDQPTVGRAINRDTPLLALLQGEVRQGDRYAYWLEVVRKPNGFAYSGKLTVFLKEDLPKLEAELRAR
jgi:hypothetical protein